MADLTPAQKRAAQARLWRLAAAHVTAPPSPERAQRWEELRLWAQRRIAYRQHQRRLALSRSGDGWLHD